MNNRLYVVGGTDSQTPVLSIEWLDLDYLVLTPLEDAKDDEDNDDAPIWIQGQGALTFRFGTST